jgi:hypothetical protein
MPRKNSNAAVIEAPSPEKEAPPASDMPAVTFVDLKNPRYRISPVAIAEQVAKSKMVIRNIAFKGAVECFPNEPWNRSIEMHYPLAEGGPLYLDSPDTEADEKLCERKRATMVKHGLRYVILKKNSDLQDVQEQLDAFAKAVKESHGDVDDRGK